MRVAFFTGIFFHVVKSLMPILALLPTLFNYEKNSVIRLNKLICLDLIQQNSNLTIRKIRLNPT